MQLATIDRSSEKVTASQKSGASSQNCTGRPRSVSMCRLTKTAWWHPVARLTRVSITTPGTFSIRSDKRSCDKRSLAVSEATVLRRCVDMRAGATVGLRESLPGEAVGTVSKDTDQCADARCGDRHGKQANAAFGRESFELSLVAEDGGPCRTRQCRPRPLPAQTRPESPRRPRPGAEIRLGCRRGTFA